ncbi:hypothetical protein LWI29_020253 [Acer saccharum]|uniref:RNase H type-1 domain-containing protein n=1 Tax=Acer saccharum TaxID=4024 RepID=A0AA39SWH3_ACESA|nr:hypothetical protein LWI29_020253 [Acer saccharum]
MAVSWVNDGDFGNLALVDVIFEVRAMLKDFKNLSVCFVSRDANVMADGLAKSGSVLDGENVVWSVF